ncbi:hypothetical protein CHS0354_011408 [Potamilus streckersoni]|uniref:Uncharacterized protein n=1 Tax=Potamilus streckersoni TaxID=2493646 RepID=A0AAE0TG29_9BIVA|nr:hypothetical protein CHS0354_011408 [Potamilus streckersoni]
MGFHLLFSGIILVFMHSISEAVRFDLNAYEYIQKFKTPLALGSCPTRRVRYKSGVVINEKCSFSAGNQGQSSHARDEYPRNMSLVTNASQLLDFIGLCEGRAVSYIGILNDGDCVAINMSRLVTFSKKHVTHVYKNLYQTKVDTLDNGRRTKIPADYFHYVKDSFYLNRIGYGGLEVILVNTQFSSSQDAKLAAEFHMKLFSPSTNLDSIANKTRSLKKIMVISLSTLSDSLTEIRKYKGSEGLKDALKFIKELEKNMRWNVRGFSRHDEQPVSYEFLPFANTSKDPVGLEERSAWKVVCLLEIKAHKLYKAGKKLLKSCQSVQNNKRLPTGFQPHSCKNIKRLKKAADRERLLLHNNRSLWYNLTADDKMNLTSVFSEKISSIETNINTETKQLKKFKKGLDLETEF